MKWLAAILAAGVAWLRWEYKHAPLLDEHGRPT